jgi:hypothetical protein
VCACKRAAGLLNGVRRGLGHTFAGGSAGSEASVGERLFVSVQPFARERVPKWADAVVLFMLICGCRLRC